MANGINEKRIVQLTPMEETAITELTEDTANSSQWYMPIDFDKTVAPSENDYGTLRIPMSRIAMLGTNGKVAATMLPSYVDDMICGTFTTSGSSKIFTDDLTGKQYAAPHLDGYETPPDHVIFNIHGTNVQYRYLVAPADKFEIIPASLALSDGYGISHTDGDDSTQVSVLKPTYYHSDESYGTDNGNNISTKIFSAPGIASDTLTLTTTSGTGLSIDNMKSGAYYAVRGQLKFVVSGTLLPKTGTVYIAIGNKSETPKKAYLNLDYSVGIPQFLNFDFGYSLADAETSLKVWVGADDTIPSGTTVTVYRIGFYVTEIL